MSARLVLIFCPGACIAVSAVLVRRERRELRPDLMPVYSITSVFWLPGCLCFNRACRCVPLCLSVRCDRQVVSAACLFISRATVRHAAPAVQPGGGPWLCHHRGYSLQSPVCLVPWVQSPVTRAPPALGTAEKYRARSGVVTRSGKSPALLHASPFLRHRRRYRHRLPSDLLFLSLKRPVGPIAGRCRYAPGALCRSK